MNTQQSWDTYNEFLAHGTLDRFTKMLARYDLFRRIVDLPGDIVEAGVFKGTGLLYWARLIHIFSPHSARRVIGFDTFEGYPDTIRGYEKTTADRFEMDANYEGVSVQHITQLAESLGLKRIQLVPGDAAQTIPLYASNNPGMRISLLNVDFDTHDATRACLTHLYPLVVPGGLVVFDDYGVRGWGESDAVDQFLRGRGITLNSLPWATSPTAFFEKPRG